MRISRLGLLGAASVLALGLGLPAGAAPVVHGGGASWLGEAVIKVVGVSAGGSVGAGGAGVSAGADAGTDGSAGAGADVGTGDTGSSGGTGGTGTGDTGTGGTGTGGTGTGDTGTGGTGTGDTGTGGTGTGGTDTGGTGGDSAGSPSGSPTGDAARPSVTPSHATVNRSDVPQNSPLSDRLAAIVDVPKTVLQPALIPSDNCISGAAPCPMGSGQVSSFSQAPSTLQQGASGAGNGAVGLSATAASKPAAPQPAARTSEGLGISLVDPVRSDNGLLVQGVIVNLSGQDRAIPAMRVELLNSANQVVQRSLVRAPVATLAGGAHKTFKTLIQPLPPNVARVSVAFIPQ